MPAIGLGVFQTPPAETVGAVEAAIATGYRLIIDTAAAYANEREVGEGVAGHPDPRRIDFRPVAESLAVQNSRSCATRRKRQPRAKRVRTQGCRPGPSVRRMKSDEQDR